MKPSSLSIESLYTEKPQKTGKNTGKTGKNTGKTGKNTGKTGKNTGKLGVPPTPKTLKLTPTEKSIIHLLGQGIINPQTLMSVLKCKKSAVYEHLGNLRKKGLIDRSNFLAEKFEGTLSPTPEAGAEAPKNPAHPFKLNHQIRLHGQQFKINILWSDNRYEKLAEKNKIITIDGNTIICNREVVQIHGIKTFVAESTFKAVALSMDYYNRLFVKVQNDLKIILIKNRAQNVDMVRLKLGETNNEITQDAELSGNRIRIYAKEDGKLWFDMDESWYLQEAHFLHSQTAQRDTETVTKHLNDWRDNNPPTNTELTAFLQKIAELQASNQDLIKSIVESNRETAAGLAIVVKLITMNVPKAPQDPAPEQKKEVRVEIEGYV